MIKKYEFSKILKKYNAITGCSFKLPQMPNILISHDINVDTFSVTYTSSVFDIETEMSLGKFIYDHISASIHWEDIKNIILLTEGKELNLNIEIWPPNKIRYAYLEYNYHAQGIGNLGKSCMRKKSMQKALNFYVKNKVRVVVVVDDSNKIHARALLWDNVVSTKLKTPFTYLDRVYAKSETLLPLFSDLAKEKKWQMYPSTTVNKMDKNLYKKDVIAKGMCWLPYMDTFKYLYLKDNLITSSTKLQVISCNDFVVLEQHTNSGYYPELDPDKTTEKFTGNFISKKEAVFIKRYNGWVAKKNIANINGTFYSTHDNKITASKIDGYILKENAVEEVITHEIINKVIAEYSTKYKGHIHKSNIVYINGYVYHKKDKGITCFNSKWYRRSQSYANLDRSALNKELEKYTSGFYVVHPEDYSPYWKRAAVGDAGNNGKGGTPRKGELIPKEHAIIAYNLVWNPIVEDIEYQEVYRINNQFLIPLVTGELIVSSADNKKHLKKFNNKWYLKQDFEPPDKKQLVFSFMKKEKDEIQSKSNSRTYK